MMNKINMYSTSRSGHNFIKDNLLSWNNNLDIKDIENPKTYSIWLFFLKNLDVNLICMRDYLNTVASLCMLRISFIDNSILSWIFLAEKIFPIDNKLKIEFAPKKYVIFFEEFRNSKSYRKKVCKVFEGSYNENKLNELPVGGMPSSFDAYEWLSKKSFDGKILSTKEVQAKQKEFFKNFTGQAQKMKVHDRWQQIQEKPEDKEFYIAKLKEFPEAIKLYIDNYLPNKEQLEFLKKYEII